MSITSAKTGATDISLALDNNYMEPIATTLVGSGGVNQVTFNDIPQNYKHLQLRVFTQSGGDNIGIQLNSDVGSNYNYHYLVGNGTTASSDSSFTPGTTTYLYLGYTGGSGWFNSICDILDYTNTNKYKVSRTLSGSDHNGSGTVFLTSGLWRNTNAINSLKVFEVNGSLPQYSRISLYGIKG